MSLPILKKIREASETGVDLAGSYLGISLGSIRDSITSASGLGGLASKGTGSNTLGSIVEKSFLTLETIKDSFLESIERQEKTNSNDNEEKIQEDLTPKSFAEESLSLQKLIADNTLNVADGVYELTDVMVGMATNAARDRLERFRRDQFAEEAELERENREQEIVDALNRLNNTTEDSVSLSKGGKSADFFGNFFGTGAALAVTSTLKKAIGFFSLKGIGSMLMAVPGLAYVVLAGYLIYEYWEEIKEVFSGVMEGFESTFKILKPTLVQLKESMIEALDSLKQAFLPLYESIIKPLIEAVSDLMGVDGDLSTASKIGKIIGKSLGAIATGMVVFLTTVFDIVGWVSDKISDFVQGSKDFGVWISEKIVFPLMEAYDYIVKFKFLDDLAALPRKIGEKIYEWWEELIDSIRKFVIDSIASKGAIGRRFAKILMTDAEVKEQETTGQLKTLSQKKREAEEALNKKIELKSNDSIAEDIKKIESLTAEIGDKSLMLKNAMYGGLVPVSVVPAKLSSLENYIDADEERKKGNTGTSLTMNNISRPVNNIVQNSGTAIVMPTRVRNENISFAR